MLKLFYLENCPYCKKAFQYIEKHNKQYNVQIELIEERKQEEIANTYDYYYVPCFYKDEVKIHEGAITEKQVIEILKNA